MMRKIKSMLIAFCLIFCISGFFACSSEPFAYEIEVDKYTLSGETDIVTIKVKLKAKRNINVELNSSSYVDEMIVGISLVHESGEEYLYDSFYNILFDTMNHHMKIEKGEMKERTETFSRYPFANVSEYDNPSVMPKGKYEVRLRSWNNPKNCIYTGVIITAE